MRLALSIPSLAAGGAERQFAALAAGLAARGHEVLAVTLGRATGREGALAGELGGARLVELGAASRLDAARTLAALAGLLRRERPQVHYAFLPSCTVRAWLVSSLLRNCRLALGVRSAGLEGPGLGRAGRLLLALEACAARGADLVIANAEAGRRHCLERGFPAERLAVVENGVDLERFRPDRGLGLGLRARWGAGPDTRLVGLPARLDPLKDHATFLRAAALLASRRPELRFVCVGGGPQAVATPLRRLAAELGLEGRLVWAGEEADMPAAYNALDALCLSSRSEGFPNALVEALACGAPCAATDVGDCARILGPGGALAPAGEPEALARSLARLLDRVEAEGEALRAACRQRAVEEFPLSRMVAATEALLAGLIQA